MNFLKKLLLSTTAVLVATYLLPGISLLESGLSAFFTALIVAVLISILNVTIKPLLQILTIPMTIVTFGLFLLVINAIVILIVDYLVSSFQVEGFWWALFFSLLLSLVNSFLSDVSK